MPVHACIDRVLPLELREEAQRLAALENPANQLSANATELALEAAKKWKPGRELRVKFLEGHPTVRRRVEDAAMEWTRHANIGLTFVDSGDAEIRIAFANDGSWSGVGTDVLVTRFFKKSEPTMNFGWLTPESTDDEVSGVVLHEFGHALGCIHEHQSPAGTIVWNKDAVYADLSGPPNNWDRATIDFNMFEKYDRSRTQFSEYDPASIMHYAFPVTWTLSGGSTRKNTRLSKTDKTFIRKTYGAPKQG
ncbi:MAG TPA: M12 family metallopeptidase [Luteitalea sp.]|nr:M12 family metallopeptidase [Luteitalea sp.]